MIKNCSAPCIGRISQEDYHERVRAALRVLEGQDKSVLAELRAEMESAAAALPYLKTEALATARALLARKFRGPIESAEDKARRVRFLQGRGFDYDVIKKALAEPLDDPLTETESGP